MKWLKRIRGALGMGVTWAVGWGAFGILIGVASKLFPGQGWDPLFRVFDAPLPAMAIPGFFGGLVFSAVLGIAGRRRRFDELSLPRFAAWGALGGLLLGLLPIAMSAVGLATLSVSAWQLFAVISVPLSVLCAASATGSLALARMSEDRALLVAGKDAADSGLTDAEMRELLDGK